MMRCSRGLYKEPYAPHPQLWGNIWSERGSGGVVGIYSAEKGGQDQLPLTSAPHRCWCQLPCKVWA